MTKILIVEDNVETADLIALSLRVAGYELALAKDGEEAVSMASTYLPDLILMDMMLPKMNGFEATALIRQNPKTRHVLILAATAASEPEKCMRAGCDAYLFKPFTYKELTVRVQKLLERVQKPAHLDDTDRNAAILPRSQKIGVTTKRNDEKVTDLREYGYIRRAFEILIERTRELEEELAPAGEELGRLRRELETRADNLRQLEEKHARK
jgi:CheY-like chemotaxis protein